MLHPEQWSVNAPLFLPFLRQKKSYYIFFRAVDGLPPCDEYAVKPSFEEEEGGRKIKKHFPPFCYKRANLIKFIFFIALTLAQGLSVRDLMELSPPLWSFYCVGWGNLSLAPASGKGTEMAPTPISSKLGRGSRHSFPSSRSVTVGPRLRPLPIVLAQKGGGQLLMEEGETRRA